MDELIAFLRARYDEREQAANAAIWHEDAGTWRAELSPYGYGKSPGPRWYIIDSMDDGVVSNVDPQASEDEGVAQHIALNDPAYVLADLATKRKILDLLAADLSAPIVTVNGPGVFTSTGGHRKRALKMARLLAGPYADHPDYRPEWAPDA